HLAFERGAHVLREIAARLGGTIEVRQNAPGFYRAVLSTEADATVVDLVLDRAPQLCGAKITRDGLIIDRPDEIFANKLGTLVGRAEERDLIDVMFLERSGLSLEEGLAKAVVKDGGCTAANLAWILSEIKIPDGIVLPAGIGANELREYLANLVKRLRRHA